MLTNIFSLKLETENGQPTISEKHKVAMALGSTGRAHFV